MKVHQDPIGTRSVGYPSPAAPLSDPDDLASSLALASAEGLLRDLARVAATRSVGEPCFKEAGGRGGWTRTRSGTGRAGTAACASRPTNRRSDSAGAAPTSSRSSPRRD
jgi:hypothetical protein